MIDYFARNKKVALANSRNVSGRFWKHVNKTDGCWLWVGSRNKMGYGRIMVAGKRIGAHRVSYKLHKGEIPKGMFICHSCDNPSCVRPDHLFPGTASDNAQDCIKKGRKPVTVITEQGRLRMSISKIGDLNPAKRPEVRLKISQSKKGLKGKPHSLERRQRQSIYKSEWWAQRKSQA